MMIKYLVGQDVNRLTLNIGKNVSDLLLPFLFVSSHSAVFYRLIQWIIAPIPPIKRLTSKRGGFAEWRDSSIQGPMVSFEKKCFFPRQLVLVKTELLERIEEVFGHQN